MHTEIQTLEKNWTQNKTRLETLVALLPEYVEGVGDITRCVFDDGDFYDLRSIRSVLTKVTDHFASKPVHLRRSFGEMIHCKRNCPLPLNPHIVLLPVKIRKSTFKNDPIQGYLIFKKIDKIERHPDRKGECRVQMTNGQELPVRLTLRSMQFKYKDASQISFLCREKQEVGAGYRTDTQLLHTIKGLLQVMEGV